MQLDSPVIKVAESYITEWALPKEHITGWVKWVPTPKLRKIELRTEADVTIISILHIPAKIFFSQPPDRGLFEIPIESLQIDGFTGFQAKYNAIPDEEREIRFTFTFVTEEGNQDLEMSTQIIRPLVNIISPPQEISVSKDRPLWGPVLIQIANSGRGDVIEWEPYIEAKSTGKLKIERVVRPSIVTPPGLIFVKSKRRGLAASIRLSGHGIGLIQVGFKYRDRVKNEYRTALLDVIVDIKEKRRLEVPITGVMEGAPGLLLEPILA